MRKLHFTIVAGARPNFVKVASLINAVKAHPLWQQELFLHFVHTGQHHDPVLSGRFLEELHLPQPDVNLGSGSGTHAEQTGKVMVGFEKYLAAQQTDCVIVVGDVNSTLACALVAAKAGVAVAHVEAGLESGDRSMPEEINRLATDAVSNFFFCTSRFAMENLVRRGHPKSSLFLVGNTMIDTLKANLDGSQPPTFWEKTKLQHRKFGVLTLHRPSNVDDAQNLSRFLLELDRITPMPLVFPTHPRTRKMLDSIRLETKNLIFVGPASYLEFVHLMKHCQVVLTDSGGIQEETTYLSKPCITLRENTERPETVSVGSNVLVGQRLDLVNELLQQVAQGQWKKCSLPELWDGQAGTRIVNHLVELLAQPG